jgi:short-subunit dehydrogenase
MAIKGKKIILTGGAGGIGSLVMQSLQEKGAEVVVVDRVKPPTRPARFISGDLSTMAGINSVARQVMIEAPDILVNLAGVQYLGPIEEETSEHVVMTYMVNLVAPVLLSQAVLPVMKLRGNGQIVNIGSILGSINYPYLVTYSSAKGGLQGFSEALRRELYGAGIDVTYIAPRAVKTGLSTGFVMQFAERTKMKLDEPQVAVKRIVDAISARERDVFVGFPERFFVLLNAIAPRFVDAAISGQTIKARSLFTP